ncbi:hypothetical protein ANCCAN_12636 [Ancylostoma caninum]|uniref:Uncharacterized protein n=1 Tax=Ancylostoma caninum TaxID=29170 RepID=A0A368GCI3_ANCCA|nr:hypothetical protein ANCCAN_12636 [Ancylostoma caninum]
MFLTTLQVTPATSTSSDLSSETSENDTHLYRPTPLSSLQTFGIVSFLAFYSFIYLIYAQHHKVLFYVMTSLIVLWIVFIYTAGILSVLYMITVGYDEKPQDPREKDVEAQQESSI